MRKLNTNIILIVLISSGVICGLSWNFIAKHFLFLCPESYQYSHYLFSDDDSDIFLEHVKSFEYASITNTIRENWKDCDDTKKLFILPSLKRYYEDAISQNIVENIESFLIDVSNDASEEVRVYIVTLLGYIGSIDYVRENFLNDNSWLVRRCAALILASSKDLSGIPVLIQDMDYKITDNKYENDIMANLERITQQHFNTKEEWNDWWVGQKNNLLRQTMNGDNNVQTALEFQRKAILWHDNPLNKEKVIGAVQNVQ